MRFLLGLLIALFVSSNTNAAPRPVQALFCDTQSQIETVFDSWTHKGAKLPEAVALVNEAAQKAVCAIIPVMVLNEELVNRVDADGKVFGIYKVTVGVLDPNGIPHMATQYGMAPLVKETAL